MHFFANCDILPLPMGEIEQRRDGHNDGSSFLTNSRDTWSAKSLRLFGHKAGHKIDRELTKKKEDRAGHESQVGISKYLDH